MTVQNRSTSRAGNGRPVSGGYVYHGSQPWEGPAPADPARRARAMLRCAGCGKFAARDGLCAGCRELAAREEAAARRLDAACDPYGETA
jgi:hypothetical protein